MNADGLVTVEQLEQFTHSSYGVAFRFSSRAEKYLWIQHVLCRFFYFTQRKKNRAVIKGFIRSVTGYSNAQLKRLLATQRTKRNIIPASRSHASSFRTVYTTSDVARLIEMDNAHGRLSGPATRQLFVRGYELFHDDRYVRLKDISVSHIYNLRERRQYLSHVLTFTKTRPTNVPIGERRKPRPDGKPGYIREDSVHQGDQDKEKGVYHINLVDEVTQMEFVGCVEGISERFLAPLLEAILEQFPFRLIEFHSDNGSEYINYVVAKLLNKLQIEQTKSRPRKCNDNALVEGKNGSIIRKHMGYAHIPRHHAKAINRFYQDHFNTYVNFHRPSGYATITFDKKGKEKKIYNVYETPYEHFKKLPNAETYLKEGVTFTDLDRIATAATDLVSATMMQKAKHNLFKSFSL